jgi:HSP20 family protein
MHSTGTNAREEVAMALQRRSMTAMDLPDIVRRWFDDDVERVGMIRVEEYRENGDLVVRAELPGIDPEKDVELTVEDGVLRIDAHREERSEHKDDGAYRSEFRYGSFSRALRLPKGVKESDVTATYKDGLLEVRVPKVEEAAASATKIPIAKG